ncbi:FecR family protein [Hymenobacter coccineus]|uniref:FecR protein domain-containing protein n=1 Tax=Hymenobacter coccineus TaxID=1908235 RepID=A0A1G1TLR4_9BACT|nr:FecR domain-containing protein [Hymenobacter coccineus]OGX91795.1 hypothetical protein BEN49_04200 [Hymenobacter coccineus]
MDFTRYSVDDFVLDESFQAFVAGTDAAAVRFWQAWLREHAGKQAEADAAFALVQGLGSARPYPVPAGLKRQELLRLRQARRPLLAQLQLRRQRRGRFVAVALVMALLTGGWWQWGRPAADVGPTTQLATGPGKHRTLTLPDGSVVVLNGNSTLTTAARWTTKTPREVWLTGEGYFRVAHLAPRARTDIAGAPASVKFVVHAGGLTISVLGTQFDVNSRPAGTKVVLSSGRVAVDRPAWLTRENLLMQPGDLVETSVAQPGLARRRVQPALYSAWTQGQLRFRQTPVREIVQLLRDAYSLRVDVSDPTILRQTITGDVSANNLDLLLPALAKSLDIQVTRTGDLVRFEAAAR